MNHLSFPHKGKAGCVRVPLSSPLWADSVSFTRDTYQYLGLSRILCIVSSYEATSFCPNMQAFFSVSCPLHMLCRISASTYFPPPLPSLPFLRGDRLLSRHRIHPAALPRSAVSHHLYRRRFSGTWQLPSFPTGKDNVLRKVRRSVPQAFPHVPALPCKAPCKLPPAISLRRHPYQIPERNRGTAPF